MKHILVLISFFVASFCFSQGIEFYHGSFKKHWKRQKTKKNLFLLMLMPAGVVHANVCQALFLHKL